MKSRALSLALTVITVLSLQSGVCALEGENEGSHLIPVEPGNVRSQLQPADLRVAFPIPHQGITVYSGNGDVVKVWRPQIEQRTSSHRRVVSYYWPQVHPDQRQLLYVLCNELQVGTYGDADFDIESLECNLVNEVLASADKTVINFPDLHDVPISPVYSPDGSRIALINGVAIVLVTLPSFQVATRFESVFATTSPTRTKFAMWSDLSDSRQYLRWSEGGEMVFAVGRTDTPNTLLSSPLRMSPPRGIAEVALKSHAVKWLNLYNLWFVEQVDGGRYSVVENGEWVHREGRLPQSESVVAMFGSVTEPVTMPTFSPDRRYYFYRHEGEGWFWKDAIIRCETETGRKKTIRTIARGLYRE